MRPTLEQQCRAAKSKHDHQRGEQRRSRKTGIRGANTSPGSFVHAGSGIVTAALRSALHCGGGITAAPGAPVCLDVAADKIVREFFR